MKKISFLTLFIISFLSCLALEVSRITCEMADAPLAVATSAPRFGWQLTGSDGEMQSAYQVELYAAHGNKRYLVWNS